MSSRLLSGLIFAAAVWSQSLHVPASTTNGKAAGTFSVLLDAPQGKAPVALQWDLSVPSVVAIAVADITTGTAAESARKKLTCAVSTHKPAMEGGVKYTCILVGGRATISNGPIALVHYRVQADVHGAPIRVAIEKVMGVSADLKSVLIDGVDAIIKVQ